jgi:RNA polymerase sigma-70 factor (ECF subfamily)
MEAYERYGRALLRKAERIVGNREDARDIVQALFADLVQRSDAPTDLPYLYRAVTNRCLTFLRDETNRARLLARHDDALAPAPRTACDDRLIGQDLVVKLVRELDPGESEVLAYRYLDDMTQEEIAELLGLSRKTIGKRLDRIREAVRKVARTDPGGGS